jgi:hypothetical protein
MGGRKLIGLRRQPGSPSDRTDSQRIPDQVCPRLLGNEECPH